jgi:hypothetical protein
MYVMKNKPAMLKAIMALSKLKPASRAAILRNELKRRGRDPSASQGGDSHEKDALICNEVSPK